MFGKEYYSLVAGFREYTLDAEAKGFDAREIIAEVLEELSSKDACAVKLLYTYYDCENIIAHLSGRATYNPLGNLTRELIEEGATSSYEDLLPQRVAEALSKAAAAEGGEDTLTLEKRLFEAYYAECAESPVAFLRSWSELDRAIRNISAALVARSMSMEVDGVVVGGGDVTSQIVKSSAADFGLRGEFSWLDTLIAAVGEESNMLEKERKIDLIKWSESEELLNFDYFNINAVLSYLVKVNIVARWRALDERIGREMFERMVGELSAKEMIK